MFPQCGSWFAKIALSLQSAQVCVQPTQDHCINTQLAMLTWESSWRRMRNDEDFEDPLDKATKHRPTAVYNRWFRVLDLGSRARMQLYLFTRIPMAHVFGMARFLLGSHGLRVDRGRWEGGQLFSYKARTCKRCISPSLVDDECNALFVCPSTACIHQDFSEVVQQCSFGSPELSLKALMAYPDVKIVASFVYCCSWEVVPPQLCV
jgi:hypothetical protein